MMKLITNKLHFLPGGGGGGRGGFDAAVGGGGYPVVVEPVE
jgi:hypothetical protein